MRRALIAAVVLCFFALLSADQPIRHLQGPASGGGGASSTPVDVMNFPTDEDGNLSVVVPVANRVIDLLPEGIVTVPDGMAWDSETFATGAFNKISLQGNGISDPPASP